MEEENINKNNSEKNNKNNKKHKHNANTEIEKLKNENAVLNDKILRISAEMANIKKRHDDEISKIYRYEGEGLIKKLLVTLDNFERAISMDDDNKDDEVSRFLNGFILIYNDLKNNLSELGVEEISCLHEEFDPNSMNAVLMEHVEGLPANKVSAVLQKGYKYNDKVIRPAMVKVSE